MGKILGAILVLVLAGCDVKIGDDTDSGDGRPSGLRPYTDALTGCQYLRASTGGIIPRMQADGKQVCRSAK